MSGRIDPRQLAAMLRADAQKMGISVEELIKRIMGGGQNVVGHLGAGTIPQGPTFISAHGDGVWNDIEPPVHEPMDDFEELAQDREQALVEGGGDDLAREVLFRKRNLTELQAEAKFTRTNPPSVMAGVLGQQATVHPNQPLQPLSFWQGNDPETTVVTVTIIPVQQISDVNIVAGLRPFARIKFGTSAFAASVDVDIGKGRQFSLTASQVNVSAGMDEDNNGDLTGMTVAGMLSFNSPAKPNAATRTIYVDNFANGGTLKSVLVPSFATRFWIATSPNSLGAGGYQFACRDNSAQLVYQQVVAAGSAMVGPFPLSGDVNDIQLDNTGTTQIFQRVIFELSF